MSERATTRKFGLCLATCFHARRERASYIGSGVEPLLLARVTVPAGGNKPEWEYDLVQKVPLGDGGSCRHFDLVGGKRLGGYCVCYRRMLAHHRAVRIPARC